MLNTFLTSAQQVDITCCAQIKPKYALICNAENSREIATLPCFDTVYIECI